MGNDGCFRKGETLCSVISIHVPSWGTTYPYSGICTEASISIHVPSWGTTLRCIRWYRTVRISIHVPSWGTTKVHVVAADVLAISIHVPSWGTTQIERFYESTNKFQSTFPRGERRKQLRKELAICLFQSTFPRGERHDQASAMANSMKNFNPRSLVGNDGKFSQIFFVFLCNKYNFSTFYYPFSLFFSVIHVTFLIFVVRILPAFYVYF